jgi:hypothetical protein
MKEGKQKNEEAETGKASRRRRVLLFLHPSSLIPHPFLWSS